MEYDFKHFKNSLGRIYCTIRYSPGNNMVSLVWKGTAPEASIKEVKATIMELLGKHDCRSIVNDVQGFFSGPTGVLADLTESEWDKEVNRMGVQYIAHVLKPDTELPVPSQNNVNGLQIKFFSEKLDALNWLKQAAG